MSGNAVMELQGSAQRTSTLRSGFSRNNKKYVCCFTILHSKRLLFATLPWIAAQFAYDSVVLYTLQPVGEMRLFYYISIVASMTALTSLAVAFKSKYAVFTLPAIIYFIACAALNGAYLVMAVAVLKRSGNRLAANFERTLWTESGSNRTFFHGLHELPHSVDYFAKWTIPVCSLLAIANFFWCVVTAKYALFLYDSMKAKRVLTTRTSQYAFRMRDFF